MSNQPQLSEVTELLKALDQTPNTLATLISELSDSELRWRNSEGYFSVVENICHFRDIEVEGYATRINRILDETDPDLADIDGGRLAVERSYNEQDADLARRAFADARTQNLERLAELGAEKFDREGTLEGVGQVSLRRLLEMMLDHDEGHLEDVRVLRQRFIRLRQVSPQ